MDAFLTKRIKRVEFGENSIASLLNTYFESIKNRVTLVPRHLAKTYTPKSNCLEFLAKIF